jgi:hypothetical protein
MAQLAFIQGMQDKDQRRELIKEEKKTSLDQAIDLVISLERHKADFDAPRGLDLFTYRSKPGGSLKKPTGGARDSDSRFATTIDVDRLASQMNKLVLPVQLQEKGRSNGQDSQGGSNHPGGRPQPVNGGYPCTRHPQFQASSFKEFSIPAPPELEGPYITASTETEACFDPYEHHPDHHDQPYQPYPKYQFSPLEYGYSSYEGGLDRGQRQVHFEATPMDIDSAPRIAPRGSCGRFSGAPFPSAPPRFAAPRPGAAFPTGRSTPGPSRLPPAPGILRKGPSNPQAFDAPSRGAMPRPGLGSRPALPPPLQTGPPLAQVAARNPTVDRHTSTQALRPTSSISFTRQIRETATNTPITLWVQELIDLCPEVRREFTKFPAEAVTHMVEERGQGYGNAENTRFFTNTAYQAAHSGLSGKFPSRIRPSSFHSKRAFSSPISVARVKATIQGHPQTVIIDSGCSGFMMCQGAVRQCNLISRIDREGAKQRCFRVANGAVEMSLGIIRDVTVTVGDLTTVMDATVCAAATTDILLGVKFLAQVDEVLRILPPVLEMTNSQQKCSVAVDYSGHSRLHQFDQYAFSCVDRSDHYLSTCSSNEAQLLYAGDSDSRQILSHYNYVMSATEYA